MAARRRRQVRYLTRIVTADDYDAAARLRPETCPLYYMGDRRSGRSLLADCPADASVTVAALATHLSTADAARCYSGAAAALVGGIGSSGYMRAFSGRGLLEGMAAAVGWLSRFLADAGPAGLTYESWALAVRDYCDAKCVQI
jgi:hypothetical protein